MKTTVTWSAVLVLWACLFFAQNTSAQMTDEQRTRLLQLSEMYRQQEIEARREVEAFARKHRIPLEMRDSSGALIGYLDRIVNNQPIYLGDFNEVSQASLSADRVKTNGGLGLNLSGAGQILGIWEAGGTVRATHQEFNGRVTNLDGSAATDHATHVAGTMIAAGIQAGVEGFSHTATLRSYDSAGDNAEMAAEAANTPIRVSNHSYGSFAGWDYPPNPPAPAPPALPVWYGDPTQTEDWKFGAYDTRAQAWDNIAFLAPFYLIVKAAGNDRNDFAPPAGTTYTLASNGMTSTTARESDGGADGYDSVPTGGNAKNILTVGAVNPIPGGNGYTGPGSVTMSAFSGWGPSDDGRIKPDVVADGVGLNSCGVGADNDYTIKSGTSMAAPSTAGTIGLLLEHWADVVGGVPRAATMKGLLINQADEVGPNNGPDYQSGWGHINAADAAELLTIHSYDGCTQLIEGSVAAGNTFTYTFESSGNQAIKATLVWNDPAFGASNNGTLNPAGANYLVNDLNLRITSGTSTFRPWVLDPANPANAATTGNNTRDNVEQVLILNPGAGSYSIEVIAPAALVSGPQNFSLVFSGNDADVTSRMINTTVLTGTQTIAARQTVTLGPAVTVPPGANIRVFAGQSITMTNGFRAEPGCEFLARIAPGGGCGEFSGSLKLDNYPGSKPSDFVQELPVNITENRSNTARSSKSASVDFQVSPNPATSVVNVEFNLDKSGTVNLYLSNQLGEMIKLPLSSTAFEEGRHQMSVNLESFEAGVYFCVLQTAEGSFSKKLVVLRH